MLSETWRFTVPADDVEIVADFDAGTYQAQFSRAGSIRTDEELASTREARLDAMSGAHRSVEAAPQTVWPTMSQWLQIVRALATAHFMMRRPPRDWVSWFERKSRAADWNEARMCQLVAAFHTAATLLPGLSRCLPRSMALLDFLAGYGFRGRWVFAVRPVPFEAHCWVEWGDLVLTDHLDHTRWFMVFLVVD